MTPMVRGFSLANVVTSDLVSAKSREGVARMNAEQLEIDCDSAGRVIIQAPHAAKGVAVASSLLPSGSPRIDLRSAASGAAIELDNIVLKRRFKTTAILQLVDLLKSGIPAVEQRTSPSFLITPTVIVMDRVVRSKKPGARLEDVIKNLESIAAELEGVASQPQQIQQTDPERIKKLRSDCLDISRFAASLRRPASNKPRNNSRS